MVSVPGGKGPLYTGGGARARQVTWAARGAGPCVRARASREAVPAPREWPVSRRR